jgi:hypothetical protein
MCNVTRAALAGQILAVFGSLFVAHAAFAQPAPGPAAGAPPETSLAPRRVAKPAPKPSSSLEVVPWFSLSPEGPSLIRTPGSRGAMDLAAREDQTYVTVYGHKKTVDLHADREHDYGAPSWSEIAMPRDIPIGPPGSCSSGAYRTIGGQPANGADLMGGLGGGRC